MGSMLVGAPLDRIGMDLLGALPLPLEEIGTCLL